MIPLCLLNQAPYKASNKRRLISLFLGIWKVWSFEENLISCFIVWVCQSAWFSYHGRANHFRRSSILSLLPRTLKHHPLSSFCYDSGYNLVHYVTHTMTHNGRVFVHQANPSSQAFRPYHPRLYAFLGWENIGWAHPLPPLNLTMGTCLWKAHVLSYFRSLSFNFKPESVGLCPPPPSPPAGSTTCTALLPKLQNLLGLQYDGLFLIWQNGFLHLGSDQSFFTLGFVTAFLLLHTKQTANPKQCGSGGVHLLLHEASVDT